MNSIGPRVYPVGQCLAQTRPHKYDPEDISEVASLAVDIADAALDATSWPSGKPK